MDTPITPLDNHRKFLFKFTVAIPSFSSLSHWSNRIIFTSVFLSDFELVKHEKVDECFNHAEQAETGRVMVWRRIGWLTRRPRSCGSESFLFLTQRKQSRDAPVAKRSGCLSEANPKGRKGPRAAEFLRIRATTKKPYRDKQKTA